MLKSRSDSHFRSCFRDGVASALAENLFQIVFLKNSFPILHPIPSSCIESSWCSKKIFEER